MIFIHHNDNDDDDDYDGSIQLNEPSDDFIWEKLLKSIVQYFVYGIYNII